MTNNILTVQSERSAAAVARRDRMLIKAWEEHERLGFPKDLDYIRDEFEKFAFATAERCWKQGLIQFLNTDQFHNQFDYLVWSKWFPNEEEPFDYVNQSQLQAEAEPWAFEYWEYMWEYVMPSKPGKASQRAEPAGPGEGHGSIRSKCQAAEMDDNNRILPPSKKPLVGDGQDTAAADTAAALVDQHLQRMALGQRAAVAINMGPQQRGFTRQDIDFHGRDANQSVFKKPTKVIKKPTQQPAILNVVGDDDRDELVDDFEFDM